MQSHGCSALLATQDIGSKHGNLRMLTSIPLTNHAVLEEEDVHPAATAGRHFMDIVFYPHKQKPFQGHEEAEPSLKTAAFCSLHSSSPTGLQGEHGSPRAGSRAAHAQRTRAQRQVYLDGGMD